MRVGLGYDIHRTVPARPLVLGGVDIPHDFGLEGHSDADVVLHALMDAMLGAAGLGDIGRYFPPSDPQYRGVSSLLLLTAVNNVVEEAGYRLHNASIVVVAERPRIAPHIGAMQSRIAGVLATEAADIGISATTNEGVGPEGRQEAISAQAVVLLETVR